MMGEITNFFGSFNPPPLCGFTIMDFAGTENRFALINLLPPPFNIASGAPAREHRIYKLKLSVIMSGRLWYFP